jgi:hypothetical protein
MSGRVGEWGLGAPSGVGGCGGVGDGEMGSSQLKIQNSKFKIFNFTFLIPRRGDGESGRITTNY